jgi:hypothetical protein
VRESHIVLHTYALFLELQRLRHAAVAPAELVGVAYEQVTEGEPWLAVTLEGGVKLKVEERGGRLVCLDGAVEITPPPALAGIIRQYSPTGG